MTEQLRTEPQVSDYAIELRAEQAIAGPQAVKSKEQLDNLIQDITTRTADLAIGRVAPDDIDRMTRAKHRALEQDLPDAAEQYAETNAILAGYEQEATEHFRTFEEEYRQEALLGARAAGKIIELMQIEAPAEPIDVHLPEQR